MAIGALVDRYWNLTIINAGVTGEPPLMIKISCNKYLMNLREPGADASDDYRHAYQALLTKQAGIDHVYLVASGKATTVRSGPWGRIRVGKGRPDDMEELIAAGTANGTLSRDQAKVQLWADAHIGVDCTGFVSAYFSGLGKMPVNDAVNAGCFYFLQKARAKGVTGFVWDVNQIQPDDVLLWMDETGKESRKPGHISVVSSRDGSLMHCGESSGEPDGLGHSGPRRKDRTVGALKGTPGNRYFDLPLASGTTEKVIVIRPF